MAGKGVLDVSVPASCDKVGDLDPAINCPPALGAVCKGSENVSRPFPLQLGVKVCKKDTVSWAWWPHAYSPSTGDGEG